MTSRPERKLLELLLVRWEASDAGVIADWCDEHHLEPVAEELREGPSEKAWQIVNALGVCWRVKSARAMFAPPTHPSWVEVGLADDSTQSQVSVLPFGEEAVEPAERVRLRTDLHIPTKLLRVMFDASCLDSLAVDDLRIGHASAFAGGLGSAPARVIDGADLSMPDFDLPTGQPGQTLDLFVTNTSDRMVIARVAARVRIFFQG